MEEQQNEGVMADSNNIEGNNYNEEENESSILETINTPDLDSVEGLDGYKYKDLKENVYINLQLTFNIDYIKQLINSYCKIDQEIKLPPTKVRTKGKQEKSIASSKYYSPKPNTYGYRDKLLTIVLEVVARKIITGALILMKESKAKTNKLESRDIHIYIRQEEDLLKLFSYDPFLYEVLTQIDGATASAIKSLGLREFPSIKTSRKNGIYKLLPIKACDLNKMLHKIDYLMSFQTETMSLLLKLLNTLFQYILTKSMRNNQTSDSSTLLEDKLKRILGNGLFSEVIQKRDEIDASISKDFGPDDKVRLTFISIFSKSHSTFNDSDDFKGYSIQDQLRVPCYSFLYNIRNPKKIPQKIPSKDELTLDLQKLQIPDYVFVYNSNIISPHDRIMDLGIFTHGEKIFYMPKKTFDEIQIVDSRRGYTAEPRKIFKMSDWRPKDKTRRIAAPNRPITQKREHDDFTTGVLESMTELENTINSLTELYSELNIIQKYYDGDKDLLPIKSSTLKETRDSTHKRVNDAFEKLDKIVDQEYENYENQNSNSDQNARDQQTAIDDGNRQ